MSFLQPLSRVRTARQKNLYQSHVEMNDSLLF